jgi:hypothetical protein
MPSKLVRLRSPPANVDRDWRPVASQTDYAAQGECVEVGILTIIVQRTVDLLLDYYHRPC